MWRRPVNHATVLCVLLAAVVTALWLRSFCVADTWTLKPRPAAGPTSRRSWSWETRRVVASVDGRLVWKARDELVRASPTAAAGARDRRYSEPASYLLGGGTHGRIPGVAAWSFIPEGSYTGRQRYFAVSWPVLIAACLILPAARALRRWRSRPRGFPLSAEDSACGPVLDVARGDQGFEGPHQVTIPSAPRRSVE